SSNNAERRAGCPGHSALSTQHSALSTGGQMANGGVLVIAEPSEGQVASSTLEVLGAGRKLAGELGAPLAVAVLGQDVEGQAQELIARGADRVDLLADARLSPYQADTWVPVLADLIRETGASVVLLSHTQTG